MAANSSFTLQGANPLSGSPRSTVSPFTSAGTPAASALNFAQSSPIIKPTTVTPNPTTPLKSHTVNADGSTKTEYHNTQANGAANPGVLTSDQVQSNLTNYNTQHPQNQGTQSGYQGSTNLVGTTPPQPPAPKPDVNTQLANSGIYGGLIGQGVNYLTQAGDTAKDAGLLRQAMKTETQNVYGNPYYSGSVKVGQAANIAQQEGAKLEGLSAQQQALTDQGKAYLSGAGAYQPGGAYTQVPYGTQYGTPADIAAGGGSQGTYAPQVQASNYANDVVTGKRTYDDAVKAMGLYGGVGKQILDAAIKQANPNFNFAQAETLGANQGSVGPAYQFAQTALQNVVDAMGKLSGLQTTNIPAVNAVSNFVSTETGAGSEATRGVTGAVQTLRNAYASLLAANKGGTPTDYSAQASAEIPDKPTPNDLAAIKSNFEKLGGARAAIYGNPGSAAGASSASGGTPGQAGGLYDF